MVFEEVERLQREYTDKYVVVDAARPELARFADYTGIVKTINYNGRALVEFLDFNANIGWFDIGLDFIKIVPKPDPNAKKLPKANTPAESKAPTKEEKNFKPAGAKSSTADILAAARAKGGSAPAAAKPAAAKAETAKAAAPAAKPAGGKLSTAEILAKLRELGPVGGGAAKAPSESEAPEAETEEAAAPVKKAAAKKPAAAAEKPTGPLPTTTADKIEFCRRVDAKG